MVVPMPPINVAKPIGIRIPEGAVPVFRDTLIRIGRSKITIGTLFTNALRMAPITKVNRNESAGDIVQSFASTRPTGSSAPVCDKPCPIIIKAHTATRAS